MRWAAVRRRLFGCGILCALAAVGGRGGRAEVSGDALSPLRPPPHAATPAFRLGTAGRPFAWSSAIGDLNADGRPDYAIADRIGRRAAGFSYAIELSITGGRSESLRFESEQDALTVTLRDVDHDRDLDLVVTGAVSRRVVGVWLNDGTGRFHRAATQTLPAGWRAGSSELGDAAPATLVLGEPAPRAGAKGLTALRASGDIRVPTVASTACDAFRSPREWRSTLRPRAPPRPTVPA
jgi:VCBS repeat protein